jgi:beta-glucanase (GH16 family)
VQAASWRQVFDDEFDGTSLDPNKWRTREQAPGGRRLCATPSANRVAVSGGTAVLSIKRVGRRTAKCPHGVFTNAMIGTATTGFPGYMAKYGTFAARIKFQSGQGQHGAFWMQGPVATGAEIDAAEYYGDGRHDGGLSTLVHHNDASGALHSAGGVRKPSTWRSLFARATTPATSWHVYSVDWSPRGYVFRLDGHALFRTRKPYVARSPEIMVLSLLTSDWELPALNTTTSTMQVDWVRGWQR